MEHKDSKFKNICKDWINGVCSHNPCKFIHDKELCIKYYFTSNCNGKCGLNHFINQELINQNNEKTIKQIKQTKLTKQIKQTKHIKPSNTETFTPNYSPPEMRILFEYGQEQTNLKFQSNDVVIVPDLFSDRPNIYTELLEEIFGTKFDKQDLIIPWHEGCHLIVDDKLDWKKDCPTFNYIIERVSKYFAMDVKATRFNWMQNLQDHKFFHYDGAALKPEIAKKQNATIGVSFGYTRDIAFQVASHPDCRKVVSIPLPNGYTYLFNKDVNIDWRHGVPPIKTSLNYKSNPTDGRISIVAWGYIEQIDIKPDNHI